jgi:hypothetical protein
MDLAYRGVAGLRQALPNAMLCVISGMSLTQLGDHSAARAELERAEKFIRTGFDFDYDMWWWRHWVTLRLLLAEVQLSAVPRQATVGSLTEKHLRIMTSGVPSEKAVFCQALEISDPEQRRQFLDQTCGADKALRKRVEELLALSSGAGEFFNECRPALEPAPADAEQVLSHCRISPGP